MASVVLMQMQASHNGPAGFACDYVAHVFLLISADEDNWSRRAAKASLDEKNRAKNSTSALLGTPSRRLFLALVILVVTKVLGSRILEEFHANWSHFILCVCIPHYPWWHIMQKAIAW